MLLVCRPFYEKKSQAQIMMRTKSIMVAGVLFVGTSSRACERYIRIDECGVQVDSSASVSSRISKRVKSIHHHHSSVSPTLVNAIRQLFSQSGPSGVLEIFP